MSIDAVALLRITNLPAPSTPFGPALRAEHRGDASLISTFIRFDSADPDEHALSLRRLLGAALDAHDDPRGILFFSDIKFPKAATYDAIVSEMSADGGVWAPKVDADYVPTRYRGSPRHPHDALVGEMIRVMGHDAALELDMMAAVNRMLFANAPERHDAVEAYQAKREAITSAMGAEFVARYEASLDAQIEETRAAQARVIQLDWSNETSADVIPECYVNAPENSHEALVAEMIKVMGPEAIQLDMTASIGRIAAADARGVELNAAETYRAQLDAVARAMGAEFAARYEASLQRKVDACVPM